MGAGDIASCSYEHDELTAKILDTIPGTVFTVGDNAYESGTAAEFADCYTPTWGRHKDRTWPTPGNHEYRTAEGAPYYEYFGARAGTPGLGYYSYDLGGWHIVALNSNISMSEGSAQERWLRADLAGRADQCVLAYWHEPRFSSGWHGNAAGTIPLWRALHDSGAEIVVNGHDHDYERFAPQTPDGTLDQERGIRQFVVGTGGRSLRPWLVIRPNSEARNNEAHGVLKLTLYAGRYDWEFIPIAGQSYSDAGSGTCHGGIPPESPPSGIIDVRVAASADDAEESATGGIALMSTDIELVEDYGSNQTVGLRFAGLAIPRGAAITTAYVQFQVDEVNTTEAAVTIAGEATDYAMTFKYTTGNISSRPRTGAAVAWTLPAWSTIGAAGPDQRTPNLAAVLQEIVNRPGWTSGNALALIITGTGRRVADAYDGSPAAALLHVEFQPPDAGGVNAGRSTVTTNLGTVLADGTSNATITVTLLDGGGAPVVGHGVSLSQSGASVISAPSGQSDANGQVRFTVTNTTPETVYYTATDLPTGLTITQTAQVRFIPVVDAGRSTVTTNVATLPADGTSNATITVTLRDASGAPVVGHDVSLGQSGSSIISAPGGSSDANGRVTFNVTSTTSEVVTYTATDVPTGLTITQTAQVTFAPVVDAGRSTVTTNVATLPADGTSNATITVTLLDGSGAPVVGHDVSLGQSGSSIISAPGGSSDANGQVTFSVTNTTPEVVNYTATDLPTGLTISQAAQVTFVPAVDAGRSIVATNVGTVRADGTSNATITVTLLDAGGTPVVGHGVSLAQTGSSVISAPSGLSDANGRVTFTVTCATPEAVTYTATDVASGLTITQTAQVTCIPPVDAGRSTVTTNLGVVIADGTSNATITVTLLDAVGAPVSGHGVSLAQTGSSVIGAPSGLSDANGQVTFTVTHTMSEAVTYTATDVPTGATITQTAQVTFKVKTVLNLRIAAGPDDAEESAGGIMYLESTDLELVFDYNIQAVGLRFASVAIPPGSMITTAYLQFQTDEANNTDPVELRIQGQATDHATPFSWTIRNISPRPRTSAAVAWAPAGWSIAHEAGLAQRTPDLAAVLQEIVNRPGWTSGNALALIITGTGKRVAHSFDGAPATAPLLHVEFIN